MKFYSEYSRKYVLEVCDALNTKGYEIQIGINEYVPYSPENLESITNLLQKEIFMSLEKYHYLLSLNLINTGKCPYTGEPTNSNSLGWTYMNNRKLFTSNEGFQIMKREAEIERDDALALLGGNQRSNISSQPNTNSSSTSGCYIATVCYGDENAPEVVLLKSYRDKYLNNSFFGKAFISFYYSVSPTISNFLKGKMKINAVIRHMLLDKIIKIIKSKYNI